jgi:hypothetical protein
MLEEKGKESGQKERSTMLLKTGARISELTGACKPLTWGAEWSRDEIADGFTRVSGNLVTIEFVGRVPCVQIHLHNHSSQQRLLLLQGYGISARRSKNLLRVELPFPANTKRASRVSSAS